MHELGIVINIVEQIEDFAKKNSLTKIDKLVLEIGELSSVVPKYIEDVYPMAVEQTMLQDTTLQIIIVPARVLCKDCHTVFNDITNKCCPKCNGHNLKLVRGQEFNIKEIVAY